MYNEVDIDFMEYENADVIASMNSLGAMYPRNQEGVNMFVESNHLLLSGPAGMPRLVLFTMGFGVILLVSFTPI